MTASDNEMSIDRALGRILCYIGVHKATTHTFEFLTRGNWSLAKWVKAQAAALEALYVPAQGGASPRPETISAAASKHSGVNLLINNGGIAL
jgi:hypothetical protein